ncbi:hypothetical protein MXD63_22460 [Frankia sp. Cpl3]|uniref:hypothetical protein n=1 Tax=Parafrankia colletiae TaxID=573497 RepID=UPI0010425BF5|nr:hypothetical protein [Parafrankia colletiae]MCK9902822.1 hypothetical protein [Frankia sp. Cpl3]
MISELSQNYGESILFSSLLARIDQQGVDRVRRLVLFAATLLAATSLSFLSSSPASAASLCGQYNPDWSVVQTIYPSEKNNTGNINYGAAVQFLRYNPDPALNVVRIVNLQANGKSGVLGKAGTSSGGAQLGQTGDIGVAPTGAWCSDIEYGLNYWVCGYLGYSIGSVFYTTGDRCIHY